MNLELISECCICRDWRYEEGYYTPTVEERRNAYINNKDISHGFCEKCVILYEEKNLR